MVLFKFLKFASFTHNCNRYYRRTTAFFLGGETFGGGSMTVWIVVATVLSFLIVPRHQPRYANAVVQASHLLDSLSSQTRQFWHPGRLALTQTPKDGRGNGACWPLCSLPVTYITQPCCCCWCCRFGLPCGRIGFIWRARCQPNDARERP